MPPHRNPSSATLKKPLKKAVPTINPERNDRAKNAPNAPRANPSKSLQSLECGVFDKDGVKRPNMNQAQAQRPPNRAYQIRRADAEDALMLHRFQFFRSHAADFFVEIQRLAAVKDKAKIRFQPLAARPYFSLLESIKYERVLPLRDINPRFPDVFKMKHGIKPFTMEGIERALNDLDTDDYDLYWLGILVPRIVQPGLLEDVKGWTWCKTQTTEQLQLYQSGLDELIPKVEARLIQLSSEAKPHLMEEPLHNRPCALQMWREDVIWAINTGIEVHRDNMQRIRRLRSEGVLDLDPWNPGCKLTRRR